jgi:hypothetical protein
MTHFRKAQYERYFNEWGLSKKRKKDAYKVIGQKIKLRRTRGKDSDVYLDGELMPRKKIQKEISRQGYMTTSEQISQDHGELVLTLGLNLIIEFTDLVSNDSPNSTWIPDTHSLKSAIVPIDLP